MLLSYEKYNNKVYFSLIIVDIILLGGEYYSIISSFYDSPILSKISEKNINLNQQIINNTYLALSFLQLYIFDNFIINFRITFVLKNLTYMILFMRFVVLVLYSPINNYSLLIILLTFFLNSSFIIVNSVMIIIDIKSKREFELKENYENSMMKVIHDLKNPFNSIIEMVKDRSNNYTKVLANISSECNDGISMLENLKLYFKINHKMEINESPQKVDLHELVENFRFTHNKLAVANESRIIINHPKNIPNNISIHTTLVKRIINNLISNAIKHTVNGKIIIKYDFLEFYPQKSDDYIEANKIKYDDSKMYIKFEISDSGYGICESKLYNIFETRYSDQSGANWDGTGLGLPICLNICTKLESAIHYKSEVGKGSVFVLFYPIPNITRGEITYNEKVVRSVSPNIEKIEVFFDNEKSIHECYEMIVAEDNLGLLRTYKSYFDKNKFKYKVFTNGYTCYNYIKNNQCPDCHRVLITDNQMPMMNGKELAASINALNLQMTVIMLSADEIKNDEGLFHMVYEKPMILKNFKNEYNKILELERYKLEKLNDYEKTNDILKNRKNNYLMHNNDLIVI